LALTIVDVVAEEVGLDGWVYRPRPAPDGMVRAAVAAGLLDAETARLLAQDELQAAMEQGWGKDGPDPVAALRAALRRARAGVAMGDITDIMRGRAADRCRVEMPRARAACVRRAGHPGPHRSGP
jgi:hypothetical protein